MDNERDVEMANFFAENGNPEITDKGVSDWTKISCGLQVTIWIESYYPTSEDADEYSHPFVAVFTDREQWEERKESILELAQELIEGDFGGYDNLEQTVEYIQKILVERVEEYLEEIEEK